MLAAWLRQGSEFATSKDHVTLCRPVFFERTGARHDLAGNPASVALFAQERDRRADEDSEPDEVP